MVKKKSFKKNEMKLMINIYSFFLKKNIIVKVETTGIIPAQDLFVIAVNVLLEKIKLLQPAIEKIASEM